MMTITTTATMTILLSTAIMALTTLILKKTKTESKDHHSSADSTQKTPSTPLLITIFPNCSNLHNLWRSNRLTITNTNHHNNLKHKIMNNHQIVFLLNLIIGLYHEWNQGSLEWSNWKGL